MTSINFTDEESVRHLRIPKKNEVPEDTVLASGYKSKLLQGNKRVHKLCLQYFFNRANLRISVFWLQNYTITVEFKYVRRFIIFNFC